MKKKFPNDTKDIIEQLYASKILENFPLYGKFWEELIGVRQRKCSGHLLPYGLKFTSLHSKGKREEIKRIYEEITMAHYSLFLALAGTHFQIDEMQKILRWKDYKRRYFNYWEAFEVCYIHLGSTLYQAYHLWALYFKLCNDWDERRDKSRPKVKEYLAKIRKKCLLGKIKKVEDEVKVLRDNIVHFARHFNWPIQEGFLIPYVLKSNVSWTKQRKVKGKILSHIRAKNNLITLEKTLNELHEILLTNLLDFFDQKKIQICK